MKLQRGTASKIAWASTQGRQFHPGRYIRHYIEAQFAISKLRAVNTIWTDGPGDTDYFMFSWNRIGKGIAATWRVL